MRTSAQVTRKATARKAKPIAELVAQQHEPDTLKDLIVKTLDDGKAVDIVTIDLEAKSSLGDYMVIAGGLSHRQVNALADQVVEALKAAKHGTIRVEGRPECNWVIVDAGSVIVHVFQPEARAFYNLEKMWSGERPVDTSVGAIGQTPTDRVN